MNVTDYIKCHPNKTPAKAFNPPAREENRHKVVLR